MDLGPARVTRRRSDASSASPLARAAVPHRRCLGFTLGVRFVFASRAGAVLMTRGSRRSQAQLASWLESGSAVQARMAAAPAAIGFSYSVKL
jgi:hypothetical protein